MKIESDTNHKPISSTREYSKKIEYQRKKYKKMFLTKIRSLSSYNNRCTRFSQVNDSCSLTHQNSNSQKIKKERMKTFKEFLINLPNTISSLEAKCRYEKYKEQLNKSMESIFYDEHKDEEWFLERYNPFFLQENKNKRMKHAQEESKTFAEDYINGKMRHLLSEGLIFNYKKKNAKSNNLKKKHNMKERFRKKLLCKASVLLKSRKAKQFHGPQSNQLVDYTLEDSLSSRKFLDNSIFIQGIPLTVSRARLLEIFQKVVGFESLILSDPIKGSRKIQYGWAKFETRKILEKVILEETQGGLNGKKVIGTFYLNLFPKTISSFKRRKPILKNIFSSPKRLKHDLKQAFTLIMHLDKVNGVYSHRLFESREFLCIVTDVQRMNMAVEYLQRVHLLCYYQAQHFLTKEYLLNKFPSSFVRRRFEPSRRIIYQNEPFACERLLDDWWIKMMKEVSLTHETSEKKKKILCEENTTEIKKGKKYRCVLCRKAFKGTNFVEKHILNKHNSIVELYLKRETQFETLLNYSNDPKRLNIKYFRSNDIKTHVRLNGITYESHSFNKKAKKKYNKQIMKDQDAPLPESFEHVEVNDYTKIILPKEKIRTVRDYTSCKEITALDHLLDYGFGDYRTSSKFNL